MAIGDTSKEDKGLPPEGEMPAEAEVLPSDTGVPVPEREIPQTNTEQGAQVPEAEEKFDYNAEMLKVETHYAKRMRDWEDVMKEVFKTNPTYQQWLKDNENLKVEKDSPAERLMPMAQSLKKKQFEIVEEKHAAILALDKKRDENRMKRIEQI